MQEYIEISGTNLIGSRIALGTWAIGGWMWGGTDEEESIRTIHAAFDHGINLIDTAPIYGYGRSEAIVGEALHQHGRRESVILATKVGIDWTNGKIERNSTRQRILKELEDSLRRLQTDYIDIYQVHWPDPLVPSWMHSLAKTLPSARFIWQSAGFSTSPVLASRSGAPVIRNSLPPSTRLAGGP